MDPDLVAASRALSAFEPLGALKRVALRKDAPALALRGIAMAQLGELGTARKLLRSAARAFEGTDAVAEGRCLAAEGEVALAARDLIAAERALGRAAVVLETVGDRDNALFARLQLARRFVVIGELGRAETALAELDLRGAPARLVAAAALVGVDIAARGLRSRAAKTLLRRAQAAARLARIPALVEEVNRAARELETPVARHVSAGRTRPALLDEVDALVRSGDLVVDACRRQIRAGKTVISFVTRPVLFALAVELGGAAPNEATREALIQGAFGAKTTNESHRARLRVEIGRLRKALRGMADIRATPHGFSLAPARGDAVHVLAPPTPGDAGGLLGLLGSGEPWSTSALAAALGKSQRAVQRAMSTLLDEGRVRALGKGKARRWLCPPSPGFATTLLLVAREPRG